MNRQKLLLSNLLTVCALSLLPAAAMAQDEVASVATFDEITLPDESCWVGDDDPEDMYAGLVYDFYSGPYMFLGMNHMGSSWWNGFAVSNETSNEFTSLSDQFRSAPGGAHSGSNFAVYYYDSYDVESRFWNVYDEDGATISGMYVTNSAYVLNSIQNGDLYSPAFETGDYYKMIVTGYDINEEVTGKVEMYLADYRSENEADHYAVKTWEWCDLSPLGAVGSIHITFETTASNEFGPLTPFYVCLDDINGKKDENVGVAAPAAKAEVKISAAGKNVNIDTDASNYTVNVYTTSGVLAATQKGCNGVTTLNLSSLPQGVYIVNVDGSISRRVIIR